MQGFISYCHHDYEAMKRLQTHFAALERSFGISFWWDDRIVAGDYWDKEIEAAIAKADIIVLGITADFIASRYIYDKELPAIRASLGKGAMLAPVVLKKCSWDFIAGPFQAVPTDRGTLIPIEDWSKEDGFNKARDQTREAIERKFAVKPAGFKW